jgi:hypothetical protein
MPLPVVCMLRSASASASPKSQAALPAVAVPRHLPPPSVWHPTAMAFAGIATGVSIAAGTVGVAAPYKQQADLFKQQINQDRRLFVADYAESSWRHSESLAQAERHHAENYALTLSQYWQGDKIHRREFLQAMLMHQREVDIALRAETRENLRDELLFQNNRMNNVQLCVTVCLGVAFSVVVEGILPDKIPSWVASIYACTIGMAIMLLASSLWLSFVLIRRLNLYTAGIMHAMIDMDLKNNKKRDDGLADFDPVQTNEEFRAWLQVCCHLSVAGKLRRGESGLGRAAASACRGAVDQDATAAH